MSPLDSTGAVLALATLHEDAAGGDEQQNDGADGDAGDGGSGKADSRSVCGGGDGGVDDLDGGFGEDGVIEADYMTWCGLLLATCLKGDENYGC